MTAPLPQPRRFTTGDILRNTIYLLSALAALWWSVSGLEISPSRIAVGLPQAATNIRLMFAPPAFSYLKEVAIGLKESLQIAALGTAIAAVLALPFGVLAARNLYPLPAIPYFGKVLLNIIRTFPELVLALMFIRAIGPGPFAGVLAVGIHSIGMMGKLYGERIETVDKGALEALQAAGASPLELFRYCILPEVIPDFLSFALYRFDLNVRAATVLGIVGAGGIGTRLLLQKNAGDRGLPNVGMIIIGIVVTVAVVDYFSAKLRAKLT